MNKSDFLTLLSSMNEEDINEFIIRNGKEGKPICPFIVEEDYDENK